MVTTKLKLSMTEPQVRQIYAKQGDTGRVLDITLDQTPEDGTLRILRPDGVEVTSEAVTGGEVESGGTFESLTEADVTELTVGIEPVQDLNGYDKPWSGGNGANKFNIDAEHTAVAGSLTYSYTMTVKPNTAYTMSSNVPQGMPASLYFNGGATDVNGVWSGRPITFTSDASGTLAAYVRYDTSQGGVDLYTAVRNGQYYIQLEEGSTATTYSPYSNICPITGHDEVTVTDEGTNLLNYDAWKTVVVLKGTAVWENNGVTLTATGNDCYTGYNRNNFPNDAKIEVREGETITLAWDATPTYIGDAYIFPDAQMSGLVTAHSDIGHLSYTVASGVTYLTFRFGLSNSGVTASYKNIQIVRGTTVPTWTPYVEPHTYTTSLGQTVYGGTLDMVSGVLTVDRVMLTCDGSSDENWIQGGFSGGCRYLLILPVESSGVPNDVTFNYLFTLQAVSDQRLWGGKLYSTDRADTYFPSDIANVSALRDYLSQNNLQICYKLATPQTIQLTAQQIKTLVGTNNVWASSGDIVNITFTYGGLLSELPSDATEVVGKCYCDVEQNGVSSMPFTLNVKKNERES